MLRMRLPSLDLLDLEGCSRLEVVRVEVGPLSTLAVDGCVKLKKLDVASGVAGGGRGGLGLDGGGAVPQPRRAAVGGPLSLSLGDFECLGASESEVRWRDRGRERMRVACRETRAMACLLECAGGSLSSPVRAGEEPQWAYVG